jgi:phosphomannomutase
MKKAYLFDIDGTLTPPRQEIDQKFAAFFLRFAKNNIVYLTTGSDRPKAIEQLGGSIIDACNGVFTCCGNQFWEGEKLVYEREFYPHPSLIKFLNERVAGSKFHTRTGNHIEYRKGMINFSVVGRNANHEQRALYESWDAEAGERKEIAAAILTDERFSNLDVSIGGMISMDIYPAGRDKSQSVHTVRQLHGLPIVFMGDKICPDGNDLPAAKALTGMSDEIYSVNDWRMTELLIKRHPED